jgi:hypothetical protein
MPSYDHGDALKVREKLVGLGVRTVLADFGMHQDISPISI